MEEKTIGTVYAAENKLIINEALCKGCDLCVHFCPKKILCLNKTIVNKTGYNPVICLSIKDCIACGACAVICPDSVISVYRQEKPGGVLKSILQM